VLSGFLITGILYDAKGSHYPLRSFYIRRVLQIFPLYYGFVTFWSFLLPVFYPWPERFQTPFSQIWSWTYLTNILQAINCDLGAVPPYTGHFWSLAVEEQFYLLWPVVVLLFRRRSLMRICLAGILISPVIRLGCVLAGNEVGAYVLTPARMDGLGVGAFLALAARGPNGLSHLRRWAWPVASAAVVAFVITVWVKTPPPFESRLVTALGYTELAGLFGALIGA
jgi:peptidoglycan/LPS O-acetylase OafA/YrhL